MHAASANKNPASGPATICCMTVEPPTRAPLARSSRDRGTTDWIIAWLAERKITSPALIKKSTAYNSVMLGCPNPIDAASNAMAAART
jgi:hypothetical protein